MAEVRAAERKQLSCESYNRFPENKRSGSSEVAARTRALRCDTTLKQK